MAPAAPLSLLLLPSLSSFHPPPRPRPRFRPRHNPSISILPPSSPLSLRPPSSGLVVVGVRGRAPGGAVARVGAARGDMVGGEGPLLLLASVDSAEQIAPAPAASSASDGFVSLLFVLAFLGLSLLTVGVVYLAVQDFLQKREREKFEREEAERQKRDKKKNKKKRRKSTVFQGPKGFTLPGLDDFDD